MLNYFYATTLEHFLILILTPQPTYYYVKFEIISDDDCTVDVPSPSPHLSKALMTAIIAHA